jgi:hypothetical protein
VEKIDFLVFRAVMVFSLAHLATLSRKEIKRDEMRT